MFEFNIGSNKTVLTKPNTSIEVGNLIWIEKKNCYKYCTSLNYIENLILLNNKKANLNNRCRVNRQSSHNSAIK